VKEGVQGNGSANDEDVWWCIDGPKRVGRIGQNGKMGEASKMAGGFGERGFFLFFV